MTGKINFLLVIFYLLGVFMKRFLCVCMCIFILTISVLTYFPTCAYAADDFTLSTVEGGNISSDEANRAVNNKGDIYNANHEILFRYTPTSDYNWTYVNSDVHCSDAQVVACLRSNNKFEAFGALLKAGVSHNAFSRVMLSQLGFLVSGNSELGTDFLDRLTENYNYLNAIEYDSSTGELTLLADQVTALRKELKERYYNQIGLKPMFINSYNVCDALNRKTVVDTEDYNDIYNRIVDYDFSLRFANREIIAFNKSDFDYAYFDGNQLRFLSHDLKLQDYPFHSLFYSCDKDDCFVTFWKKDNGSYYSCYGGLINSGGVMWSYGYCDFHSKSSDLQFYIFNSYEAVYNYVKGSQNAYLSSKVEQAGEDIKLSINDMNDNIGSKIDDLIDSINNKKEGMSADELQKAIDDALASISGKIDDIGDNTEETNNKLDSLLSLMSEQNNILLQILGVTEYIAYNNTKEDGSDYTTDDLKNTFNTMFDGVRNAILYGTNTVSNSGAAVSVAAYSSEDLATQDINNLDIHNGLFGKFPFSIPYQLYEWLQVLEAEPVAPVFNYNYGFMIGKKDNPDCNLTIDLSVYEPWANQAKSFERLLFTLLMAVFIYKKFKGNSIF